MKKLLFMLSLVLAVSVSTAQNAQELPDGNYGIVTKSIKDTALLIPTGKTFTDKNGTVYPVYTSKHKKLFILRVSKNTGKEYPYYLKLQPKKQ
jgi:hypothetical protein